MKKIIITILILIIWFTAFSQAYSGNVKISDSATMLLPYLRATDTAMRPKWVKITKTYTDFSTAGLTNEITIYTLPAKGVITGCIINPTATFSGGTIAAYTISVGISGNANKYGLASPVFTGGTFAMNILAGIESFSGNTAIKATATSTVGNLNAATAGSVDIYLQITVLQ